MLEKKFYSRLTLKFEQEQNENIVSCYKEAKGNCKFGAKSCWFSHRKSVRNNGQKEERFKCRTCEEVFNLKSDLMKHRKTREQ